VCGNAIASIITKANGSGPSKRGGPGARERIRRELGDRGAE
jgi:hypothetical protein